MLQNPQSQCLGKYTVRTLWYNIIEIGMFTAAKQWIKMILALTVFIRLSAQGAYLIFVLSGWALIRGGPLFEAGCLLNFHHFQ